MRFRKYSRKHAFNILYQWDITGEPLEKLQEEYWNHLANTYSYVASLAQELLEKLEKGEDFDSEVYAKKLESAAEEEILAEKLRKELYTAYVLLKLLEDFHNFTLTFTGWLGEGSRNRLKRAKEILEEIKKTLQELKKNNKEEEELYADLIEFIEKLESNPPKDFEALKETEKEFKKKLLSLVEEYLNRAKEFAQKRLKEDLGDIKEYANRLLEAFKEHQTDIDATIEEFLKGWTIDRLGSVERNLLRLGTAEFMYVGVQDPGRAFNDYIDFAKAFVNQKAAKFVNGVLSAIYNKKVATKGEEERT